MDKNASTLAERLTPGTHFIYESNTYHEACHAFRLIGAEMVVKSGKWVKDIDVLNVKGGFRMELPKASKHYEWLDDHTVRYAIVGKPEHHVTLRLL